VNLAWDKAELESISDQVEGFDVGDFGFEIDDLPQVVMPTGDEPTTNKKQYTDVQDDDFDPDAKFETKVQKGDIWQLGAHRLMCGDSTKAEDVLRLMGEEKADLWLTDPPYNVDYSEKEQYKKDLGYGSTVHEVAIANDKMTNNEFLDFLVNCYSAAKEVMKPGASFYIWHADTEGLNFRIALEKIGGMKLSETLVWVKNQMVFGRQDFHWRHEPCLYGWKLGEGHKWYSDRSQTTVLEFDRPKISEDHPTMKPVPLFAYQIECSTKEGDIVFDDFGGSGTTIVACEQLKRKARLMEFEPHYCNVIIARWEKLTGGKAQKIEGV
jgi:site-specific DNA-methyltransferase (adenine-specific)